MSDWIGPFWPLMGHLTLINIGMAIANRGDTSLQGIVGAAVSITGICLLQRSACIAIERETDYLPLIVARLSKPIQPTLEAL